MSDARELCRFVKSAAAKLPASVTGAAAGGYTPALNPVQLQQQQQQAVAQQSPTPQGNPEVLAAQEQASKVMTQAQAQLAQTQQQAQQAVQQAQQQSAQAQQQAAQQQSGVTDRLSRQLEAAKAQVEDAKAEAAKARGEAEIAQLREQKVRELHDHHLELAKVKDERTKFLHDNDMGIAKLESRRDAANQPVASNGQTDYTPVVKSMTSRLGQALKYIEKIHPGMKQGAFSQPNPTGFATAPPGPVVTDPATLHTQHPVTGSLGYNNPGAGVLMQNSSGVRGLLDAGTRFPSFGPSTDYLIHRVIRRAIWNRGSMEALGHTVDPWTLSGSAPPVDADRDGGNYGNTMQGMLQHLMVMNGGVLPPAPMP